MSQCLILVDIQNDYFPGGKMELADMDSAAANAQMLLDAFRKKKYPVIHVQHISIRPGSTFFLPGTDGAMIHSKVRPLQEEIIVQKNYPNSFRGTSLQEILEKKKPVDLVICGAMSHMCIDATVRAAFDFGFSCRVAEDACATRDLMFKDRVIKARDVHAAFMAALSSPYAQVISTKEIIENL